MLETCRLLADELDVPLIAFAGAPFTVASYLIEGRPSRTYEHTKALMHTDEALWHRLMERLAEHAVASIDSQLDAGAAAFQLFDSWAGALVARRLRALRAAAQSRRSSPQLAELHPDVPGIHFGIGCDHLLEAMYAAGPTVIGLDWRTPIARRSPPPRRPTPSCRATSTRRSCSPVPTSRSPAPTAVLADNGGHPGHIFNLGHGVLPEHRSGRARPRSSPSSTSEPLTMTADRRRRRC